MVLLLAIMLAGPSPEVWIALGLLIPQALALYRPLLPRMDLVLTLVTMLLAPLSLEPLIGTIFAVALVLPALTLLNARLRDLAATPNVPLFQHGKWSTPTPRFPT